MPEPKPTPPAAVTVHDLQAKWDEIKLAARQQTERRVLGMTALTIGGIALGIGALGAAYWLGRRSARPPTPAAAPAPQPTSPTPRPSPAAAPVNTALNALVNAAVESGLQALTKRLKSGG
jgi:uncharacterized membrane protein YebE (DUF533 family)